MPILRIRTGSGKQVTYRLPGSPVKLGRNPSCQIRLQDDKVSRDHAQIEPTPDGYVLTDLDSGNGTLVNGNRIQRKLLIPGDEIAISTQ